MSSWDLGKQNQQKAATAELEQLEKQLEKQDSARLRNPDPAGQEFLASPSDDPPPPEFFTPSSTAVGSSRPPCGLSLYGNYALLDFMNMDIDFMNTDMTASLAEEIPTAAPGQQQTDLESRPPSTYSRPNSREITQVPTPDSIPPAAALQKPRASSKENQHVPWASGRSVATSIESSLPLDTARGKEQQPEGPHATGPRPIDDSTSAAGKGGWLSPLHMAAQKGHDRIVRVLLQHQMDGNEKDSDGLTPLMHAIIGGYEDVVASLVEHGARIGEADGQGRTALHWAVLQRRETPLKVLLKHCGRDRKLIDGYESAGRTPLHTAVDMGFEAGVHLLLEYGASLDYKARKTSSS